VARRIAHEIKNPLTPIQLSAERIRRKFRRQLGEEDAQSLEQLTEVIVRQTNDLRRIVDEFSKFARMPEPERKPDDIVDILRSVILLQEAGQPNVGFVTDLPTQGIPAEIDATMIGQAFTNLIKNAGEAIESYIETEPEQPVVPQVRVSCIVDEDMAVVRISDNGIGLPEDPSRLFEPYVTTREKGTGLGLPIVKKIIEEHGGTLTLEKAEAFDDTGRHGAMAVIRLPVLTLLKTESDINELEADAAPDETTFKM
jgi:two-component system nitrogen regulation sensor histidine kinase NtrY